MEPTNISEQIAAKTSAVGEQPVSDGDTKPNASGSTTNEKPIASADQAIECETSHLEPKQKEQILIRNPLYQNILAGLVAGVISSLFANFILYYTQNTRSDNSERTHAQGVKAAVARECHNLKKRFAYMVAQANGYYKMNAYLLPRFPDNLIDQMNQNTRYFLENDSRFPSITSQLASADYKSTFQSKGDDGTIFGITLSNYTEAVNKICGWSSNTDGDYLDMGAFR